MKVKIGGDYFDNFTMTVDELKPEGCMLDCAVVDVDPEVYKLWKKIESDYDSLQARLDELWRSALGR